VVEEALEVFAAGLSDESLAESSSGGEVAVVVGSCLNEGRDEEDKEGNCSEKRAEAEHFFFFFFFFFCFVFLFVL